MPNKFKNRRIRVNFPARFFKPNGVRVRDLQIISLRIDEAESFRLFHGENLNCEKAAKKMDVSKSTFHRILKSASEKIATALFRGAAIEISKNSKREISHFKKNIAAENQPRNFKKFFNFFQKNAKS